MKVLVGGKRKPRGGEERENREQAKKNGARSYMARSVIFRGKGGDIDHLLADISSDEKKGLSNL